MIVELCWRRSPLDGGLSAPREPRTVGTCVAGGIADRRRPRHPRHRKPIHSRRFRGGAASSALNRLHGVDVAFFEDPEDRKADQVDGAIGELSPFHETFGYYAQGVSVATAVLPDGWRDRLVRVDTPSSAPG
jgi:hypothetical protein